ncbi:GNAT family N-acetyltransferase [Sorangium sp. So ce1182]|uniref:GNAT family N-acetyltransferase n=1 Tax=Sorangium sp. So ce1182 TaxID=3133334 RepID=UPI003F5F19E5
MSSLVDLPFAVHPRIETERLVLREITESDAEALFSVCSDDEWLRLWGAPVHKTVADTRKMIVNLKRAHQEGSQLRWGISVRGAEHHLIGAAGFFRFLPYHYRAEITYEQARNASGKGYMTEALRAIVGFGFEQLDLHTIEAGIDPGHGPSLRVAERLGFKREGYLRENYFFQGKFYDTILCTMFSPKPAQRPYNK